MCARVLGREIRKGKNILMQPCQPVVTEFIFRPHPLRKLGYYYKIHFCSSMRLQTNKPGGMRRRKTGWPSLWGTSAPASVIPRQQTAITCKVSYHKVIKKCFSTAQDTGLLCTLRFRLFTVTMPVDFAFSI